MPFNPWLHTSCHDLQRGQMLWSHLNAGAEAGSKHTLVAYMLLLFMALI